MKLNISYTVYVYVAYGFTVSGDITLHSILVEGGYSLLGTNKIMYAWVYILRIYVCIYICVYIYIYIKFRFI
jgi:hypothetical protein